MPHIDIDKRKAYQRNYIREKRAKFGRPSRSKYGLPYTPVGDRETIKKRKEEKEALTLERRLIRQVQREIKLQHLATPEGKAEQKAIAADYSRQRYETDWKTNYIQKEKNQRKKSKNKYKNYVEKKSPEQAKARLLAFNNCCAYCGTSLTMFLVEFDHVIPSSKEGPDIWANIIPACHSCNQSKRSQDMRKWYKNQPFYSYQRLKRIEEVLSATPYPTKQTNFFDLRDWLI
jgi:5-methylcytosine-specific restriction endonuclease McrA